MVSRPVDLLPIEHGVLEGVFMAGERETHASAFEWRRERIFRAVRVPVFRRSPEHRLMGEGDVPAGAIGIRAALL
jgi:hypothetical protein